MIDEERVTLLNDRSTSGGRYVLYWMQASQRVLWNHALTYAIALANSQDLPVVVCFGLTSDYPDANERHYAFMLEGLADIAEQLRKQKIQFVVALGDPSAIALRYAADATEVVCDRGYLRHQRQWRQTVAEGAGCRVTQVESDVVIPVEHVSDKHESSARTLRLKYNRLKADFLKPIRWVPAKRSSLALRLEGTIDIGNPDTLPATLKLDRSVRRSPTLIGGPTEAARRLSSFLRRRLKGYDVKRNEPASQWHSWMSPYLHFGHISPLEITLRVQVAKAPEADRDSYIEELLIRRELSMNFCFYHSQYDRFDCIPNWARLTLTKHAKDPRPIRYTPRQLEQADTHDPYWNAAQKQMVLTGFMHNYMRMYWGKKIIEWSASPQSAYRVALYLNNKYFIDGRDPNSYANIAWLFGLHDRPWQQRPIFGTVRYMNDKGLERKFDIKAYVKQVESIAKKLEISGAE